MSGAALHLNALLEEDRVTQPDVVGGALFGLLPAWRADPLQVLHASNIPSLVFGPHDLATEGGLRLERGTGKLWVEPLHVRDRPADLRHGIGATDPQQEERFGGELPQLLGRVPAAVRVG